MKRAFEIGGAMLLRYAALAFVPASLCLFTGALWACFAIVGLGGALPIPPRVDATWPFRAPGLDAGAASRGSSDEDTVRVVLFVEASDPAIVGLVRTIRKLVRGSGRAHAVVVLSGGALDDVPVGLRRLGPTRFVEDEDGELARSFGVRALPAVALVGKADVLLRVIQQTDGGGAASAYLAHALAQLTGGGRFSDFRVVTPHPLFRSRGHRRLGRVRAIVPGSLAAGRPGALVSTWDGRVIGLDAYARVVSRRRLPAGAVVHWVGDATGNGDVDLLVADRRRQRMMLLTSEGGRMWRRPLDLTDWAGVTFHPGPPRAFLVGLRRRGHLRVSALTGAEIATDERLPVMDAQQVALRETARATLNLESRGERLSHIITGRFLGNGTRQIALTLEGATSERLLVVTLEGEILHEVEFAGRTAGMVPVPLPDADRDALLVATGVGDVYSFVAAVQRR